MSNANATLHQWIYVIIPINKGGSTWGQFGSDKSYSYATQVTVPLFSAYCKGCRNYYTEEIPYGKEPLQSVGHLPKYGCDPVDDIPDITRLG